MPRILTVAEIAKKALRRVGAFSINDSAPTGPELQETIEEIDLIVAHHTAVNRILHLVPSTIDIPLIGGQKDYYPTNSAPDDEPNDGIQFPIQVVLRDPSGNDTTLTIASRSVYDDISDKDQSGIPALVYIDRLNRPKLSTHPVLPDGATGYSLQFTFQAFAKDLTRKDGALDHKLRVAWQAWLIKETTYEIGSGGVRRLPEAELSRLERDKEKMLRALLQNENREHTGFPAVVEFQEF